MIRDFRPYYVKKAWYKIIHYYVRHKLTPQLASLGKHPFIVKPWHIEIFGGPVHIGSHITLLGCADKKTRLTVWTDKPHADGIVIGDHVLISPGVRISAAQSIRIGDACMLASNVYITDSDWHGIYDRSLPCGETRRVVLEENVWLGDSAIVCKGVKIGRNSIVGAGAVVTSDLPANVIAAGNPAQIIRRLDPEKKIITRKDRYFDAERMTAEFEAVEKANLAGNSLAGWLKSLFFPPKQ